MQQLMRCFERKGKGDIRNGTVQNEHVSQSKRYFHLLLSERKGRKYLYGSWKKLL